MSEKSLAGRSFQLVLDMVCTVLHCSIFRTQSPKGSKHMAGRKDALDVCLSHRSEGTDAVGKTAKTGIRLSVGCCMAVT